MNLKIKKRIGIVGLGHWGKNYFRVFNELPESVVTIICDKNIESLKKLSSNSPETITTQKYDEITHGNCDAVVIATPASSHYTLAKYFLENDFDVLLEKPMTLDLNQAEELRNITLKNNKILLVAHTFLYNRAVQYLKKLIDENVLGDIYYIKSRRTHLGLIRDDVNAMWDLAPHDISILYYLFAEEPSTVQSMGASFLKDDRSDVSIINLKYSSGKIANILVSWVDSNKERYFDIIGSKARVVFDDINYLEPIRIFKKGVEVSRDVSTFGEFQYLLRDGEIISPKIDLVEPLKLLCSDFINSVSTRSRPLANEDIGIHVVRILSMINQ